MSAETISCLAGSDSGILSQSVVLLAATWVVKALSPTQVKIKKPGEVAEWSNALDLKSSVPKGTVGSNPTLSVFEPQST